MAFVQQRSHRFAQIRETIICIQFGMLEYYWQGKSLQENVSLGGDSLGLWVGVGFRDNVLSM